MNEIIIILQIEYQTLLQLSQIDKFFYFFNFLKIRYDVKVNLLILVSYKHLKEIQDNFKRNQRKYIHRLSIIQIDDTHIPLHIYADKVLFRIKKHHNFEYLFLLKYQNNFNKKFYEQFILCNDKVVFLENNQSKRQPFFVTNFVSIPKSIFMKLNTFPLNKNEIDSISLS